MRHGVSPSAVAAAAVALCLLCRPLPAAACDEYDPAGPARDARITLDGGDLVDEAGDEIRSFIATDSIGAVAVRLLSATPPGIALDVSATPEVSRFSPYYGENLKGIAVAVRLAGTATRAGETPAVRMRRVRVVLGLRQVCARYFRNTFLYY